MPATASVLLFLCFLFCLLEEPLVSEQKELLTYYPGRISFPSMTMKIAELKESPDDYYSTTPRLVEHEFAFNFYELLDELCVYVVSKPRNCKHLKLKTIFETSKLPLGALVS